MISLLFTLSIHDSFCGADDLNIIPEMVPSPSGRIQMDSSVREKIRLTIDFDYINNTSMDEYACNNVGETVSWLMGSYNCEENDILNVSKREALFGTMENIRVYIEGIFSVDPYMSSIVIANQVSNAFSVQPKTVTETDLYINLFVRPYGQSSTLASASPILVIGDRRAIQGVVFINPKNIPLEIQDHDSYNSKFFYVCLHEIFHVFGISSNEYENYHPKGSSVKYSDYICNFTNNGKLQKFLVTPHAHQFAVNQWGEETFTNGTHSCPSGIELEDGGGSGTAESHPEARIANTDLMVGVTIQTDKGPYCRFTNVSMAMLLDTGNYDIDESKVGPLVWGNRESIDGNYIDNFITGPPSTTFPDQYFYKAGDNYDVCGFNYKFIGGHGYIDISQNQDYDCSVPKEDRDETAKIYCSAEAFYNPESNQVIGHSSVYDFQIIRMPNIEVCGDGEACIPGYSFCVPYTCDGYSSIQFSLPGGESVWNQFECNSSNSGQMVEYKYIYDMYIYTKQIRCPIIEQFCRSVEMMEQYYRFPKEIANQTEYDSTTSDLPTSQPSSNQPSSSQPSSNQSSSNQPSTDQESPSPSNSASPTSSKGIIESFLDQNDVFGLGISGLYFVIIAAAVVVLIISITLYCLCRKSSDDSEESKISESYDYSDL